jgi:hypothetical protein
MFTAILKAVKKTVTRQAFTPNREMPLIFSSSAPAALSPELHTSLE